MRVAALYDVHANLPALEAVLADPRCATADLIVSGGDLVAGPQPGECVERLLALGDRVRFLRGNADRQVVYADDEKSAWCRSRLGPMLTELVRGWPLSLEIDVHGLGAVFCCHATPGSDEEIVTRITPDAAVTAAFAGVRRVAVVGHTHVQFDRSVGDLRVVNAGSVGWPYEGRHGAFWTLLGPDVQLVDTMYDLVRTIDAVRTSGYPQADEAAASLLEGASAEEATEFFEAQRGS